ncbi:type II toxin-antitoxin system Phd/YefM family antitoxin [Thiocapsa sp. UBA6158]|jgi:prevent-host-death family protein|uniref:type II toxin-antitoxin system Phd/YefM family antitoxin n=1 Tax=Thiocapsa sp. UBA6158 TaxID=1947692 RepID=UPI0025E1E428|nr:type II toxin-antitoxin system Phd/YefM family antitoxin [Thiocapsa sp. UBA6158]
MHVWSVKDAKARFSEFLDACVTDGPQVVTRRGTDIAVLVPIHEWRRLQAAARPSLKQLLLADTARTDMLVPERGKARGSQPWPSGDPKRRRDDCSDFQS